MVVVVVGWLGARKGMMFLSPCFLPPKVEGLEAGSWKKKKKKKLDARKGKRRWDVTGWMKKSRESFGGVSRHVVELLFG